MHSKKYSAIFLLFQIKNAGTGIVWNEQILMPVLIVWVKTEYLLLELKKFQNKSKNIDEVYQSEFFRCIMFLSYRVTFLCNVLFKLIIHRKVLYDIFYEKVVKWWTITKYTQIEENFVCSEKHRAFFKKQIGNGFSFNVPFQKWLKSNTGKTYQEAIKCWKYKKQLQGHNRYERADLIAIEW